MPNDEYLKSSSRHRKHRSRSRTRRSRSKVRRSRSKDRRSHSKDVRKEKSRNKSRRSHSRHRNHSSHSRSPERKHRSQRRRNDSLEKSRYRKSHHSPHKQIKSSHHIRGNDKSESSSFISNALVSFDNDKLASELTYKFNSGEGDNRKEVRKRKSRWTEGDSCKTYIPGLPTTLPPNLTNIQEKAYILQLQIEELSRRLRLPNLGIPENPALRSPSPEPVYDQYGKRTNTRDARTRKRLEDDRHMLIIEMYKSNSEYKPPGDYKPQQIRFTDKVDIPQDDFPEINFVGLLIGPRGNSLKSLEKETGAKIIIRGKGSVKDGKLTRKEAGPLPGEDEPLHAFITGTTLEVVERATKRIHEIIQNGIDVPESMNELRRQQLRELALLNGTLRENECLNKLKILTEAETIITNTIICPICGGAGHIASDCMMRGSLTKEQLDKLQKQAVDTEYSALMKELGHNVAATQLKCLANVICTGSLTSGAAALALPSTESTSDGISADGQTEVTVLASFGNLSEDLSNVELRPLMPSGELVMPRSNTIFPGGMSNIMSNFAKFEDPSTSFFVETAQKWINDSVYTDPTMAIAAAALSQYAYHPMSAPGGVPPGGPMPSQYWPYMGYNGAGGPPRMPTNTWYTPQVPINYRPMVQHNPIPPNMPPPPPPPPETT